MLQLKRVSWGLVLLTTFVCMTMVGPFATITYAKTDSKYAAMVVNAYDGRVLFSRNADAKRYPASLTKMMTLYMLFDALEQGKISLQTKMTVSSWAANQPPSKLGLKVGSSITVEKAIRALVVKSANDVAVVLAEKLGGTERKFARAMTKKARAIGLKGTSFQNASGLPDPRQYTTARDMSLLGRKLMLNYPSYYKYFGVKTFTWKGRKYTTHNGLLKDFAGTDGIKTGYIRASGFNLVSSVKRDGYHLVGVVMGGKSPKARDNHMRQILTDQFKRVKKNPLLGKTLVSAPKPKSKPSDRSVAVASLEPITKPETSVAMAPVVEEGDASYAVEDTPKLSKEKETVTAALMPPVRSNGDPLGDLIESSSASVNTSTLSTPRVRIMGPVPLPTEGAKIEVSSLAPNANNPSRMIQRLSDNEAFYGIQIGAYGIQELAVQRLNSAASKAPELFQGVVFAVLPVEIQNRTVYRARIGPYREVEAAAACSILQNKGIACNSVVQQSWPSSNSASN